jgi:hypothetical protein
MNARYLYLLISLAISSVVFYTLYSHGEVTEYYDQATLWLDQQRPGSGAPKLNTTVESKEAYPGEKTYRVTSNGTRIDDNLHHIFNETLGVRITRMPACPEGGLTR